MNKILTMLCLLCTVSAYSQYDPSAGLTQDQLLGEWPQVFYKSAPIPTYFEFDTIVIHIYTLNEQNMYAYGDILRANNMRPNKPLGMSIWFNRGREIRCILNNLQEHLTPWNSFDVSSLEGNVVYDYDRSPSAKIVQVLMPKEGYLEITLGRSKYKLGEKGVVYVQESILP